MFEVVTVVAVSGSLAEIFTPETETLSLGKAQRFGGQLPAPAVRLFRGRDAVRGVVGWARPSGWRLGRAPADVGGAVSCHGPGWRAGRVSAVGHPVDKHVEPTGTVNTSQQAPVLCPGDCRRAHTGGLLPPLPSSSGLGCRGDEEAHAQCQPRELLSPRRGQIMTARPGRRPGD